MKPERNPSLSRHALALQEIVQKRSSQENERLNGAHDRAVRAFDNRFRDVVSDPIGLQMVALEHEKLCRDAVKENRKVDWLPELIAVGEAVRLSRGLPTMTNDPFDNWQDVEIARGRFGLPKE